MLPKSKYYGFDKCPNCNGVFEYYNNDIKLHTEPEPSHAYITNNRYVNCPECNTCINID
jgi:uncharacterized protein with PIN domain